MHNGEWHEHGVPALLDLTDVLDHDRRISAGETLTLGPWDVRVLCEGPTTRRHS